MTGKHVRLLAVAGVIGAAIGGGAAGAEADPIELVPVVQGEQQTPGEANAPTPTIAIPPVVMSPPAPPAPPAPRPVPLRATPVPPAPPPPSNAAAKPRPSGLLAALVRGPRKPRVRCLDPGIGAAGVLACDTALADPKLLPKEWRRRARLLRSRAMHQLADGNTAGALADLDAAEALAKNGNDPFYQRSMGAGHKVARGFALLQAGDADAARRISAELVATRPFSRFVLVGAGLLIGDPEAYDNGLLTAMARLDPRVIDALYTEAFRRGDFAAAIKLHPQLIPPIRVADKGDAVSGKTMRMQWMSADVQTMLFQAERAGRLAYALAATGDQTGAEHALAKALVEVVENTPRLVAPPAPGVKESRAIRRAREYAEVMRRSGETARLLVGFWARQVDWRTKIYEGKAAEVGDAVLADKMPVTGAKLDLLRALAKALPGDKRYADEARIVELLLERKPMALSKQLQILNDVLPRNESEKDMPKLKRQSKQWLAASYDGFRKLRTDKAGLVTVQFRDRSGQPGPVEEMALMRAADMAHDAGMTGFVIRARRDYERFVGYAPNGYETELDLEFVDKKALPAHLKGAEWRVIDADDVLRELEPFYQRELPPGAPIPPAPSSKIKPRA